MDAFVLQASLRRLRRRWLTIAAGGGFGWSFVCLLVLLVAAAWVDLAVELPPQGRIGASILAVTAAAALAIVLLSAAIRQARWRHLARRLDASANALGQIITGFDLAELRPAVEASPLTTGMAALAIERAGEIAARTSPAEVVSARAARRPWLSAASLAATIGLAAVVAPRLAETCWLRFSDPFGDHPPYSRTLLAVEPGDQRVLYASGLDVLVSAEGPAPEQLELVLDHSGDIETLPMFPDAAGKWRGQLAEITTPCRYFVRGRGVRSRRYQIEVITVPRLETVRWRIAPPAYTGDAAYEGPTPSGGLAGLRGTQVQVWATSNRPLSGGVLEIEAGGSRRQVELRPPAQDSRDVSGRFEIDADGKFSLTVADVAGQDSQDPFAGAITLLSDQRPFVRLLEPPQQSLATPTATLPVVVAAEDDYGVSRLQLFRSLNDSRALAVDLELTADRRSRGAAGTSAPRRVQSATFLPLASYNLAPGDVIKLFARVEDNDPAGAKGTESAVATVQIISAEDYGRMMRAREGMDMFLSKYQQAQRRMEALAEETAGLKKKLKQQPADSELAPEQQRRLEELTKRLEEEAAALKASAEQLLSYDLDQALTSELARQAQQLTRRAESLRSAAKSGAKAGDLEHELAELLEQLQDEKQDFGERVLEPLEALAELFPLLEDQQRFIELYRRQRDLAERLSSLAALKAADDPAQKARMRDLEQEQRGLREELDRLLDDIEEHAARIPESPDYEDLTATARDFAAAVRSSGAAAEMQQAETALAEFSGAEAHQRATKAAEILEQFISRCQGMGQQGDKACRGLKFSPHEGLPGDCLANTLAQLLSDAGFKPGSSMGAGRGGGYSARRNTLDNVGLYGNLPTRGNPTRSGSGRSRLAQTGAGGAGAVLDGAPEMIEAAGGEVRASGASGMVVPARYRSRVEQYFQRIAEETGDRHERDR